jgi:hypothetical protein
MKSNECRVIITIKSLAAWLNVSPPTVSMYMNEPEGLPGDLIGGRWHFHLDRVDRWFYDRCKFKYSGKKDPMEIEDKDLE